MKAETLLMVADSERDANMLYAARMFMPDPAVFFRLGDEGHLIVSDLEIGRVQKQARHCQAHSLSQWQQRCAKGNGKALAVPKIIKAFLASHQLKKVLVPSNFPHGLARDLRRLNVKVKVKKGLFFPERSIKTPEEIKKISASLIMAEVGLAEAIQTLKQSKISRDGRLLRHNVPLTAEKLKAIINIAIIQAGGVANHTIVACGRQGCDPHESGSGPLRAKQPIIIDIFPRSQKTGYHGDITRTVVRGQASEEVRKMYHTVARAQDLVFSKLRDGATSGEIDQSARELFERAGYKTGKSEGRMQGFFHSTGHGLGLELHEAPRVGPGSTDTLRDGHVVTVEPGLYYYPVGGVRIEDVALITKKAPRNLTKFEKTLEV
jgi:Xaa-Pro aminopeptidase